MPGELRLRDRASAAPEVDRVLEQGRPRFDSFLAHHEEH